MVTLNMASLDSCIYSKAIEFHYSCLGNQQYLPTMWRYLEVAKPPYNGSFYTPYNIINDNFFFEKAHISIFVTHSSIGPSIFT